MENYKYKAQDAEGKTVSGTLAAENEQNLHERLKAKNLMLMDCELVNAKKYYKPLKVSALAEYARQIGTLIQAGIPLVKALQMLSEDEAAGDYEKEIYKEIVRMVMQGIPLSDAMESAGGVFPPLIINMFRAAETGGNMDSTALKVAEQYTKEDRMNATVKSALTYPKILAFLIVVVVLVIFGYVMPQFDELFASMSTLPLPTRIMMAISDFVRYHWLFLIVFGVSAWLAAYFLKKIYKVAYYIDKIKVKMPKAGRLMKTIYTARFARTLNSLYSAGIPIITCLSIARKTIGNLYIEKQFEQVIADTQAGLPLSVALDRVDGFVKKLTSSVKVGEEAGSLDNMLESMADNLEFESEKAIQQLVSYLEPVMIIIMAAIVGFIMLSVIVPIYQSYQYIGKG